MKKFNIGEEIPEAVKCENCGAVNTTPDNIVFRIDPDRLSVFSEVEKHNKDRESDKIFIISYCIGCTKPVYEIKTDAVDFKEIDEETAWLLEWEEMQKKIKHKYILY